MLKTSRGYQRERCMQESQSTVWEADFRGMVLSPSLPLVIKPTRTDIDLDRSVKRADLLRWGEPYRGPKTRAMALCGPAELPDGRVHRGGGAVPLATLVVRKNGRRNLRNFNTDSRGRILMRAATQRRASGHATGRSLSGRTQPGS